MSHWVGIFSNSTLHSLDFSSEFWHTHSPVLEWFRTGTHLVFSWNPRPLGRMLRPR